MTHPTHSITSALTFTSRITTMVLVALVLMIASSPARAQWTTNGNNINNTNSGNVGIGTTSPGSKVVVVGAVSTDGAAKYSVQVIDSAAQGAGNGGGIVFTGAYDTAGNLANFGSIQGIKENSTSSNYASAMLFTTRANGGAMTERLRMTSAGNVGIGTSNPTRMLEVLATDGEAMRLYRNASNVGWGVNLKFAFNNSSGSEVDYAGLHGVTTSTTAGAEAGDLLFTTVTGGSLTEKMRIASNGNVGLGTSSPAAKLEVSGANVLPRVTNTDAASYGGLELFEGTTLKFGLHTLGSASGSSFVGEANGLQLWNYANGAMVFGTNASERMRINASGNVGIGTTAPAAKLDVNGNVSVTGNITATGNIAAKYQDVAEWVGSSQLLPAGTVVVLDQSKSNQVIASTQAYDTRVAGVVSAQPGITLGEKSASKVLVATTGRVKVKVDASAGPIQVGDLLVTSDIAGVAKKSEPLNLGGVQIHRPGTLIGKALEPLARGTGEILVLLSLQ